MFYSYLWIAFAIIATICLILQSLTGLGVCFIVVATAILVYALVHFHKVQFMAFWLYVVGFLMAVPDFYVYCLEWVSDDYAQGDGVQVIIFSLIILYAVLSIIEGASDLVMRKIRCREVVNAYMYEKNIRRRNDNGEKVYKNYSVFHFTYKNKTYEIKDDEIRSNRGTRNESIRILIDKHCPYYINAGSVQGKNILKIVSGVIILVLCFWVAREAFFL